MNLTEVKKSLEQRFARPLAGGSKRNIVFWYDGEGVFADNIDSLGLDNVTTIKLYENNMFEIKLYIEETDQENNLLVYSPLPRPDDRDNWLTDTIKYSQSFSTDMTSLILLNYGIDNALRSVVNKYEKFFGEAVRSKRFEGYNLAPYSENKIDVAILSALCKLTAPNFDNVVRTLLIEMVNGETAIYESITKLGNTDTLWELISKNYGYSVPEQSLEKLAILLLCSHLLQSLDEKMPTDWRNFASENPNCFVFVDNLMRNEQYKAEYDKLAVFVAEKIALANKCGDWTIDDISDCDTFEDFDKSIIGRINDNIIALTGEHDYYRKVINSRKNRRYFKHFEVEYSVLGYACEYLELSVKHKELQGLTIADLFNNYKDNLYKLDSGYRHFVAAYDRLMDNDSFSLLFKMVDDNYTNWFLNDLSMRWCDLWDDESKWQLSDITSQQRFYNRFVSGFASDNERVIVIISDGLRYESAVELNAIINREQKGKSDIDVMLGVIPSQTALGMTALLPHRQLEISDKGDFTIDDISTVGTENRGRILSLVKQESIAVQYEDIAKLTKPQMSEKFAYMKLIYIYHNTIDARGDNAATENEVFEATEKAFGELSTLVRKLCNDISAINIIITADHGYIYRRTPLQEYGKTPKQEMSGVKSSRRYVLSQGNIEKQGTQNFSMDYLTPNNNDIYAILPRSTNCFKLQGAGSRYVHGGTSLQEVVIPVITFKSDKNATRSMSAKKVGISLTSLSHKVTSMVTHLNFHQTEPVDDKHLPLRVTVYFADESGNRISNENIIIADSTEKLPEHRVYKEKFTLKSMAYNKNTAYYLVIKDEEEMVNTEIERIPFVIDLVFGGGIQF